MYTVLCKFFLLFYFASLYEISDSSSFISNNLIPIVYDQNKCITDLPNELFISDG